MECQAYALIFPNEKSYVGISGKPTKRFAEHRATAASGGGFAVHDAIRHFGGARLVVLAAGTRKEMAELEIALIAGLNTLCPFGYNLSLGGESGPMCNPAVAAKQGARRRGRPWTAKQRAVGTGHKRSQDTLDKLSVSHRKPWTALQWEAFDRRRPGKPRQEVKDPNPYSPARVAQLATARARLKEKLTPALLEARGKKISAAKMGHAVSQETRDKIRAKLKGRPRGW